MRYMLIHPLNWDDSFLTSFLSIHVNADSLTSDQVFLSWSFSAAPVWSWVDLFWFIVTWKHEERKCDVRLYIRGLKVCSVCKNFKYAAQICTKTKTFNAVCVCRCVFVWVCGFSQQTAPWGRIRTNVWAKRLDPSEWSCRNKSVREKWRHTQHKQRWEAWWEKPVPLTCLFLLQRRTETETGGPGVWIIKDCRR